MLLHSYIVVLRFGHHEFPLLRSHVATDCIAAHGYRYAHARAHDEVGAPEPRNNSGSHIDASHSRQPLVKGERLVRYEVNAVMTRDYVSQVLAQQQRCIDAFLVGSSA
jgi:hypothetical protein